MELEPYCLILLRSEQLMARGGAFDCISAISHLEGEANKHCT